MKIHLDQVDADIEVVAFLEAIAKEAYKKTQAVSIEYHEHLSGGRTGVCWVNGKIAATTLVLRDEFNRSVVIKSIPSNEIIIPSGLASITKSLVIRFASAMAEKLFKSELKYGFRDNHNWSLDHWKSDCFKQFKAHINKGDPLDVANYCAFMWHHQWPTANPEVASMESELKNAIKEAPIEQKVRDKLIRILNGTPKVKT